MKFLPFKLSTFDVVILITLVLCSAPFVAVSFLFMCWVFNERKPVKQVKLGNHTLRRCRQAARIKMDDMDNPAREPIFMDDWRTYNRLMHYIHQLK